MNVTMNMNILITTVFTLSSPWLRSEVALLGLEFGLQHTSLYSLMHNYTFQPLFVGPMNEVANWNRPYFTRRLINEGCKYDWFVWVEGDVWITNFQIKVEDIIRHAYTINPSSHIILNRDVLHNINTGVLILKCSPETKDFLDLTLQIKDTHKTHEYVKNWEHNGATMIAHRNETLRKFITFVPPNMMNSYPILDNGNIRPCVGQECDSGYWKPGDWIAHFAGVDKQAKMQAFVRQFPPSLWTGYQPQYTA